MNLVLIGLGYWGPNLLRTFNNLGSLYAAVDFDESKLIRFKNDPMYRDITFSKTWQQYLDHSNVDGFVIATPPHTHYDIAIDVLKNGKHVFIEKPMTLNIDHAEELKSFAEKNNLIISVGHIFLYSPEIVKLKDIISSKDFGEVQYIYTQRLNLGKIQRPANVIDDLAPHDISILDFLLDKHCTSVQVIAKSHVIDTEDVAFVNLKYGDTLCHLHLSWLDPLKVRNTVVVGTKQMAICDSMTKTVTIYNTGIDVEKKEAEMSESYSNYLMTYRYGDTLIPQINTYEPMKAECQDFIDSIYSATTPKASANIGVSVVRTLSALKKSLEGDGHWVNI